MTSIYFALCILLNVLMLLVTNKPSIGLSAYMTTYSIKLILLHVTLSYILCGLPVKVSKLVYDSYMTTFSLLKIQ